MLTYDFIQEGNSSVWLAMEQKHEAAVEVLLQAIMAAGVDIDARYEGDARDKRGQTLLMRASALGLTSAAAALLALGADVAAKDAVRGNVLSLSLALFFSCALSFSLSRSLRMCGCGFSDHLQMHMLFNLEINTLLNLEIHVLVKCMYA